MEAAIIDGTAFAGKMLEDLAAEAAELKSPPHLVALQVGENPASRSYIMSQRKSCEKAGIVYTLDEMPAESTQDEIVARIDEINGRADVHGLILQMPLPEHVDHRKILNSIAPEKDAEGMTEANLGRLFHTIEGPAPCTPCAAVELVKSTGVEIEGTRTTVVGHSNIVGKPLSIMMLGLNATVTTVHVFTENIKPEVSSADILFVATGAAQARWFRYRSLLKKWKEQGGDKPEVPDVGPLVTADMVKPGAVVIDIGVNRVPRGFDPDGEPLKRGDGKVDIVTRGDVDFDAVKEVAGHITPPKGGVGPVTAAVLLSNVVKAAKKY